MFRLLSNQGPVGTLLTLVQRGTGTDQGTNEGSTHKDLPGAFGI